MSSLQYNLWVIPIPFVSDAQTVKVFNPYVVDCSSLVTMVSGILWLNMQTKSEEKKKIIIICKET